MKILIGATPKKVAEKGANHIIIENQSDVGMRFLCDGSSVTSHLSSSLGLKLPSGEYRIIERCYFPYAIYVVAESGSSKVLEVQSGND